MTAVTKHRKSYLARLISLEGAMAAFGFYSLLSGMAGGGELQMFWGVTILAGLAVLVAVRRRDWKKHWEALEAASLAKTRPAPPGTAGSGRPDR